MKPPVRAPRPAKAPPPSPRSAGAVGHLLADSPENTDKIAGLAAVAALFRRDPQRVLRLYYDNGNKTAAGPFCAQLAQLHRPYRLVEPAELARIAGTASHGGIVAAALPRPVPELDWRQVARWAQAGEAILILDGVGNPHNLGAIARTLAFFGFKHLLLSDHPAQAVLSDAAYRVAEGGLEFLDVWRAPHLPRLLKRLQNHYRVIGTALGRRAGTIDTLHAPGRPIALVLGNEENGLGNATLSGCEAVVTLPGNGQVQSLNVSATAAILLYELTRKFPRHNLG